MPNNLIKKYDYFLIVWSRLGDEEIHEPVAFQVGIDPKGWCDGVLERSNNTRDERALKLTGYKIFKLILEEKIYAKQS